VKIFTKIGDGGRTRLFGGRDINKDDPRVEAMGAVDEMNAAAGAALVHVKNPALRAALTAVQNELFIVGADLATPKGTKTSRPAPRIGASHVARLEKEIDALEALLPPLQNFILPGGSPAGAAFHLARAVCRRAERVVVGLLKNGEVGLDLQIYLNRLSDYLFLLARRANQLDKQTETPWKPGQGNDVIKTSPP